MQLETMYSTVYRTVFRTVYRTVMQLETMYTTVYRTVYCTVHCTAYRTVYCTRHNMKHKNDYKFYTVSSEKFYSSGASFTVLMICSAQNCVRKIILKNVEKRCRCTTEAKILNLTGETEENDAKHY
jgi:hypothetical protein